MLKKSIAIITMLCLGLSISSCYRMELERPINVKPGEKIYGVITAADKVYLLPKKSPGTMMEDKVVFPWVNADNIPETLSIPISEIDMVYIKKSEAMRPFLIALAINAVATGILVLVINAQEGPSCPLVYSFDGRRYRLDAEPYAGSVCRGLERTDWCPLEHLRPFKGEYRLLVTNELDETEYIDEIKLQVVDHSPGTQVFPDMQGNIQTVTEPIAPQAAYDRDGRDLTARVSAVDGFFWSNTDEGKDPDKKEQLRDEVVFEFAKPKGVNTAKLIFNGNTTFWGSYALSKYMSLYGEELSAFYDRLKNNPIALASFLFFMQQEEIFTLNLWLETDKGWVNRGLVAGGPVLRTESRVYPLDLTDVSGDTVKIKFYPPAPAWKIDYLALDYSENSPVMVKEISALSAQNQAAGDVRGLLSQPDKRYVEMPNKGEWLDTRFAAPEPQPGYERTVLLKIRGHYVMYLAGSGKPRKELLDRIHKERGFLTQYIFREYIYWKNVPLPDK